MPRGKKQFKILPGMVDVLPKDQVIWQKVEKVVTNIANFYEFDKISTPILESEELFIKGMGKESEIVEKEMYRFRTKDKERVVLRPDFTPSLIRVYIEKRMETMPKPVKLWTLGPLFRYRKPQASPYRQFHHFDFEIIGNDSPALDALLIQLFSNILDQLSLSNYQLQVNSLGCEECQPNYKRQLKRFYKKRIKELCPDCRKNLEKNPLWLLRCKKEKCKRLRKNAPQMINFLCENCKKHFNQVLEFLDAMSIPYTLNPYLIRDLDYYSRTVFEFVSKTGKGERTVLIGGGRYDTLVRELGGKPTSAVGGAGMVEAIIEEIRKKKINIKIKSENFEEKPKIFLIQLGALAKKKLLPLVEEFKKAGIKVSFCIEKDKLKTQLRLAKKKNVKYSLILGQKEAIDNTIIVRNMDTGIQEITPLQEIVKKMKKLLKV